MTTDDQIFIAFNSMYSLLNENKVSQELFENFCIELKPSFSLNEEEAFSHLIQKDNLDAHLLFIDTFFNVENNFFDLAQEVLFQKTLTLSGKKLNWFLNH